MALELEETIMREIGLGAHYNYSNGSGSCRYIREKAVRVLPEVIAKYHAEDKTAIAEPDQRLCDTLATIAQVSDSSDSSLTKTWEAASYVIAEHIHQANVTPKERKEAYAKLLKHLRRDYLKGRSRNTFYYGDVKDL